MSVFFIKILLFLNIKNYVIAPMPETLLQEVTICGNVVYLFILIICLFKTF